MGTFGYMINCSFFFCCNNSSSVVLWAKKPRQHHNFTFTSSISSTMPVYTHTQFEHYLSVAIAANGIVQLLLDIVMEALHMVPTRINHLSLTVINAFLAWKTLSAIQVCLCC